MIVPLPSRALVAALILLAAVPACNRGPPSGKPVGDRLAEGARLEKEGRWAEAAALYREEALRGPERGDPAVKRAMVAYLMADRLPDAERFAGEVLGRSPGKHEVLFYLGDSQRVLLQYPAARRTLERLLEAEPGHLQGTLALAHVLARLGEPAAALPLFRKFLGEGTERGALREQAELDLARALRRLGRHREAADELSLLLEENPLHPVALSEAAQTFFLLGKPDLAKGLRERFSWLSARGHQLSSDDETKLYAQEASPEGAAARRALQAVDRREFLAATGALGTLVSSSPRDSYFAAALARLWLRLGRFRECLEVLEAGQRSGLEENADLLRLRAQALQGLGRSGEAREARRRASARLSAGGPGEVSIATGAAIEVHLEVALAELYQGGDREEAARALERARRLAPKDPRLLSAEARAALEAGDLARARSLLESAPNSEPDPELRRLGAVLRGLAGDLRVAAREIMELVRRDPGDLENFKAFDRVFGSRAAEPEVARVLAMKRALEENLSAMEAKRREISLKPLRESGPDCLALGMLLLEAGKKEEGLDLLFLAAELLPSDTEALRRAEAALTSPGDLFLRLRLLRRILERNGDDPAALSGLARLYLEAGVRLGEAEKLAGRLAALQPGAENGSLLRSIQEKRKDSGG